MRSQKLSRITRKCPSQRRRFRAIPSVGGQRRSNSPLGGFKSSVDTASGALVAAELSQCQADGFCNRKEHDEHMHFAPLPSGSAEFHEVSKKSNVCRSNRFRSIRVTRPPLHYLQLYLGFRGK